MDKWRALGCALVVASTTLVVMAFISAVREVASLLRDDG